MSHAPGQALANTPRTAEPRSRSLKALIRYLHAAELEHLREVVLDQQTRIEELEASKAELERQLSWAEGRADMFQDLAHEAAREAGLALGITRDCQVGVLS